MDLQKDAPSDWGVPRPVARFWISAALGALGGGLLLAQVNEPWRTFPGLYGLPLFIWTACAFGGVFLIHVLEKTEVPRLNYAFAGVALALTGTFPAGFSAYTFEQQEGGSLAWFCHLVLLLAVGVSLGEVVSHRVKNPGKWIETLLGGPSIALAAPFILFASSPVGGAEGSTSKRTRSRMSFIVLR